MRHIRLVVASAVALVAALALMAGTAAALLDLAPVAASDVAVEKGSGLSGADRAALESAALALAAKDTPAKFVVLNAKPADAQGYARSLRAQLSYPGSILVLSPGNLSIASPLPSDEVQRAFDAERANLRADPVAGTIAVADRLSAALAAGGTPAQAGNGDGSSGDDGGGGGGVLLWILALGAGVVVVAVIVSRRGAKRRAAQALAARRESLEPLVDALAAQISDLDDDMEVANERTAAAKPHHATAVLSYGEARDILEGPTPQTPESLDAAAAALETGLRAARRVHAVLEGRSPEAADEEPLLEGMCAFDPKHGRATTTATISTPSGGTAELPVCDRCAKELEEGNQPPFREVDDRGRSVPYWQSRGFGGGMGPLVGGALAGVILGGMLGGDTAMGAPSSGDGGGGDGGYGGGDYGGGGDFGGGGFGGGGDFGGGGGGDF